MQYGCKECRLSVPLFVRNGDGETLLAGYECRHKSPEIEGWPIVDRDGWCGDVMPRYEDRE